MKTKQIPGRSFLPGIFSMCKEVSMKGIDKNSIFILCGLSLYRKEQEGL